MKKRLFVVTLPWDSADPEMGEYSAKAWATTEDAAIKMVANLMADSCVSEMSRKERAKFIQDRINDFGSFPTEDVFIRVQNDIHDLLSGPKNNELTFEQAAAKRVINDLLRLYGG